jgi:hypothetical protein
MKSAQGVVGPRALGYPRPRGVGGDVPLRYVSVIVLAFLAPHSI